MKKYSTIFASGLCVLAMAAYAASPITLSGTMVATTSQSPVKTASVTVLLPTPTPVPTPIANATPKATVTASALANRPRLPTLDLSDMKLWNLAGKWHASHWANEFSLTRWKFARILKGKNGEVKFVLDATGAPELAAGSGITAHKDGLWETEVTLPVMRDGMVIAPLFLWNNDTRDEVDFEFAGRKGLDVTVHKYINGLHITKTVRLFAGVDMSGQRKRFGISVS